jgi:hypothetical protein
MGGGAQQTGNALGIAQPAVACHGQELAERRLLQDDLLVKIARQRVSLQTGS